MRGAYRVGMLGAGDRRTADCEQTGVGMEHGRAPYIGAQVMLGVLLLAVDLVYVAGLWFAQGMAGWTDDGSIAPEAQMFAWRAMWYLAGGAVVTSGGLLALRWHIPGRVQLTVLGIGALEFHSLAVRH
ncbi:hypothetical protein ACWD7F_35645 [Streptomyces sp. NPDC005122]